MSDFHQNGRDTSPETLFLYAYVYESSLTVLWLTFFF